MEDNKQLEQMPYYYVTPLREPISMSDSSTIIRIHIHIHIVVINIIIVIGTLSVKLPKIYKILNWIDCQ